MVIHEAVHFLDNVIDMGKYPLMEVADMSLKDAPHRPWGHGFR